MQGYLLAGLVLLMVVLLVRFQGRSVAIFGGAMLVCLLSGWIGQGELLSNASNPGLATLIMLVIVSFALEKTSVLRMVSRRLFSESETKSLLKTISFTALASSVLNNTAVVAAMLNSVRNNRFVPSSRLLIPLSYAAIMGGTLTLIGTSTNLIVNSMLTDTGHPGFNFFDFTLVGAGVTLGGLATLYVVSRFLPNISTASEKKTEYFVEAELDAQSPLVGQSVEQAGLRHLEDLFLAEIIRQGQVLRPVARYDVLQAGDKLLFSGEISKVQVLKQFAGLDLFADKSGLETQQLTEVVIREDSVLVNKSLKSSQFRARFDAAVVAIRRDGERVSGKLGEVRLRAGDFLLLATGPDFAARTNLSKNFYLLSGVEPDNMLSGWREKLTLFGFLAMIGVTVLTGSSLFVAVLCLLALLLVSGCLKVNEIKRRFPVEIWVIVTSALCLASAMQNTGLAQVITDYAQNSLAGHGVWLTFIGVFLITYILTEIITNNAAAALMFPIAYSLALGLGVDPFPMVMGVAFAASASFISPYGYQTNLMVFNASNYRLKHFVLSGIPVAVVYCTLAIGLIPLVFPF
ncbi:SLC13 family permease [Idiomarina seosinensis]|uniref:SLC13 family permease n=1 Tax=Idiomarina seosinensis TaxID=281739 RepID=UPI00384BDB8F